MSTRASIRRIEKIEAKRLAKGHLVLNLTGSCYRLRSLQGPSESLKRCYAGVLGNCTGPMSKEHYISDYILDKLDPIDPRNLPWIKNAKGPISAGDVFNANCLCKYHNEFLSPLDALAGKMFDNYAHLMDPQAPEIYIWGPSFTRWLLKVMLGMTAAKHNYSGDERIDFSTLPNEWVEILFGLREFPKGLGLYQTPVVGAQIVPKKGFSLSTLMLDEILQGIRFSLAGMEYFLSMEVKERAFKHDHPNYHDILYQPNGLNLANRPDRIRIFWI